VSSTPTIACRAWRLASAAKRTTPERLSWSVMARARRPRATPCATICSGSLVPSRREKLVWAWSSAYSMGLASARPVSGLTSRASSLAFHVPGFMSEVSRSRWLVEDPLEVPGPGAAVPVDEVGPAVLGLDLVVVAPQGGLRGQGGDVGDLP